LETPHKGFDAKPFVVGNGFQQQEYAFSLWQWIKPSLLQTSFALDPFFCKE